MVTKSTKKPLLSRAKKTVGKVGQAVKAVKKTAVRKAAAGKRALTNATKRSKRKAA